MSFRGAPRGRGGGDRGRGRGGFGGSRGESDSTMPKSLTIAKAVHEEDISSHMDHQIQSMVCLDEKPC